MPINEYKQTPKNWVIIPAAGTGIRMGANVPKSYLPLNNSTVIETSMSCFLQHENIAGIVVALHHEDNNWVKLSITTNKPIYTVIGGDTRAQSVRNALDKVITISEPYDFVLVHDAARPCLHFSDLDLLIQQLQQDGVGGILATPVIDTIKEAVDVDGSLCIRKTVDRSKLWKALTPQMIRVEILKKALNFCFEKRMKITDEASAVEALGLHVKLIEGRSDNIKITRQEDIEIAESIISKF